MRERLWRLGSEEKTAWALASRSRSSSMAALESVKKRKEKGLVLVWRALEASLRAIRRVRRRCLGGSSMIDWKETKRNSVDLICVYFGVWKEVEERRKKGKEEKTEIGKDKNGRSDGDWWQLSVQIIKTNQQPFLGMNLVSILYIPFISI